MQCIVPRVRLKAQPQYAFFHPLLAHGPWMESVSPGSEWYHSPLHSPRAWSHHSADNAKIYAHQSMQTTLVDINFHNSPWQWTNFTPWLLVLQEIVEVLPVDSQICKTRQNRMWWQKTNSYYVLLFLSTPWFCSLWLCVAGLLQSPVRLVETGVGCGHGVLWSWRGWDL